MLAATPSPIGGILPTAEELYKALLSKVKTATGVNGLGAEEQINAQLSAGNSSDGYRLALLLCGGRGCSRNTSAALRLCIIAILVIQAPSFLQVDAKLLSMTAEHPQ